MGIVIDSVQQIVHQFFLLLGRLQIYFSYPLSWMWPNDLH